MTTKFDIGDQVFITAVVGEISVDRNGIFYEVRCQDCKCVHTLVLKEDSLQLKLKKKNTAQEYEKEAD